MLSGRTGCALRQATGREKRSFKILCKLRGRLCRGGWYSSGCGKELIYTEDLNNSGGGKTAGKTFVRGRGEDVIKKTTGGRQTRKIFAALHIKRGLGGFLYDLKNESIGLLPL